MQAGQATQALGVQLYFYVRCPTCNKVLGNLQETYTNYIKEADEEVKSLIPNNLDYDTKIAEYDNLMAKRFSDIMKKIGVTRQCCMMRIKNPQQVPISGGTPPEGNIAINRHTPEITRNPTIIHLTKRSKVPGGSNISMMSITGYEDVQINEMPKGIEVWEEKMRAELEISKNSGVISTKQIMEKDSTILSVTSFQGLVPTIETGVTVPLKRKHKLVNAKTKISQNNSLSFNDMMELENKKILTFNEISPQSFSNNINYEDNMIIDSSDFIDIQNLTLSSY